MEVCPDNIATVCARNLIIVASTLPWVEFGSVVGAAAIGVVLHFDAVGRDQSGEKSDVEDGVHGDVTAWRPCRAMVLFGDMAGKRVPDDCSWPVYPRAEDHR